MADIELKHTERESWIDNLRGFGILLVILAHISYSEGYIQNAIYSFHMPLFFFISGYLLSKYDKCVLSFKFFFNKILSLLWPYCTYSIIAFLYLAIVRNFPELKYAIKQTVFLQGYGNLWFIPCLLLAELLGILFLKFSFKIQAIIILLLMILTSVVSVYVIPLCNYKNIGVLLIFTNRILISMVFLFCGKLFSISNKNLKNGKLRLILFIGAMLFFTLNMVLCQINGIVDLHMARMNNPFYYWFFSISSIFCLGFIFSFIKIKLIPLNIYGKLSLSIMCLTSYLPFIFYGNLLSKAIFGDNMNILNLLFTWLFTVIFSGCISYFIKRFMTFINVFPWKK